MSSIKASEELNNILSKKIYPLIKYGLGYEQGSSSSHTESKEVTKVVNFQSSKQIEFKKSSTFIKSEENKMNSEVKLVNEKKSMTIGETPTHHKQESMMLDKLMK